MPDIYILQFALITVGRVHGTVLTPGLYAFPQNVMMDTQLMTMVIASVSKYILHYTQRFLKLICWHLPTYCFMKSSLQSTGCSIEHSTTCDSRTDLNYTYYISNFTTQP